MLETKPAVFLISRPQIDWAAMGEYLDVVDGTGWYRRIVELDAPDGEKLVEFMGRMCYRSWEAGLNPNVTRVRQDSSEYLGNIISSAHGSVLEHINYSFVFHHVSRVFTHELVRHRAGTAISQESLRYVRLTDIPFSHPAYVLDNPELLQAANALLEQMEKFQELTVQATGIDRPDTSFKDKKSITSAARRYAPDGLSTTIGWTANVRALRHIIAIRTDSAAEAEIRVVFDQVATLMKAELPALFGDFDRDQSGSWKPQFHKV
ncbi:FAD-dependent thymidylate synthase [Actinokineospora sp. PR83]|uniref:FAD-dependent thymidylate synthase n=1 Tax=Actinokineospora sp. PR83 TaxID=2884908 RepID=UPI001F32BD14|nr:FAD-dependent thymidylate synthase [Actinokineospora sp. PR83]MCG8917117.1 FAD-dependent thymidylate synthase [Actinokineospora sp. PR83]